MIFLAGRDVGGGDMDLCLLAVVACIVVVSGPVLDGRFAASLARRSASMARRSRPGMPAMTE